MAKPLLELQDLRTWFYTDEGVAKAVAFLSELLPAGQKAGP